MNRHLPLPTPSATPTIPAIRIEILGSTLSLDLQPWALIVLMLLLVAGVVLWYRANRHDQVIILTVDIPLGGIGRLTLNADREVARLAHQAWIELVTRKAAIPFDEENDVIEEVFNSWYDLFKELRAIAKNVPPTSLRTRNARALITVLVHALNKGLRPPLTKWHARFRTWYAQAKVANPQIAPQELQRQFPEYEGLIQDIRTINTELIRFAEVLDRIAQRAQKKADEEGGRTT